MRPEPFLSALVDWGVGEPPEHLHPVVAMGRQIKYLEKHLYADKMINGVALAAGVVLPWALAGKLMGRLPAITVSLAARSLAVHARSVAWGLEHSLEEGQRAVANMVGREVSVLDREGVIRACVESVAESVCDAVVAPLFYGAIFGGAGAMAYRAINTLDSMVGHRDERYEQFGKASARLDDVMGFVPARISGVAIVAASAFYGHDPRRAMEIYLRDNGQHPSPNSAHGMAAMAGALGLRLGGPVCYEGQWTDKPWIGDEVNQPDITHIHQAVELMVGAHMLCAASLSLAAS